MSYQSPIDLIIGQMNLSLEGEICKAVQNVGINVDKEELLKALQYDRNQYQKGYNDRDAEIVRCKDCEHYDEQCQQCEFLDGIILPDYFCADGERKLIKSRSQEIPITQCYHCNCTHCGKDWWSEDAFPIICPYCHEKLI